MSDSKYTLSERIKYSFDNFMSKGGLSVFLALMMLFAGAFVLMGIVRFVFNLAMPDENLAGLGDQLWQVFLQISDAGAVAEDGDNNVLNKIAGIVTIFLGLVLFSSLVAFITSQFEAKLDELRKGRSNVIENGHTLILGFGDRVLEIIRELIIANESERDASIVVLSAMEKDEMDDFFRERIEDTKSTRIICRSGSTSSLHMLRRVGVHAAKSVIILNDATVDAEESDKSLADARVLKTIMAVIACTGEDNVPPILAELHQESKRELAVEISPENVSVINEQSILAKLMVQTSRISGLAQVYDHMVGFDGCEFYFHQPEDEIAGKTYADILFHYATCSVLGLRKPDGRLLLNPEPTVVIEDGDEVILLAEDDSTIKYLKTPVGCTAPAGKPAAARPKQKECELIVGWSAKTSIIVDEYSQYLTKGSMLDVVVDEIDDDMKKEFSSIQKRHKDIKMRLIQADIHSSNVIAKLKPEHYDNVIILSGDGGESELRDSETIARLLEFRHYFRENVKGDVKTQLITEVADSDNTEIIQEAGVHDFLISNQFVSKIYAQVSEEPAVLQIYEDLFSEEGSELYIKPAGLYISGFPATLSFGDICAAALRRNETCLGVRLAAESHDASSHYGIYINPDKSEVFELSADDMLITLAEDES